MYKPRVKSGRRLKGLGRVLNVFRLINGRKDSRTTPVFTVTPYEAGNPLANHSLEVEARKAEALMYWQIMLNRPK